MKNSAKALIVIFLLSTFSLLSFASITSKSATFDEVQYFGIGKYILQKHRWDVMGAILHPPLSYYINSLPLMTVKEDSHFWEYDVPVRDLEFLGAVDFYRGQGLLSLPQNADDRLLIASRSLFTILGLLLGYYVYRFSRELYGRDSGMISLILFTFCPNILAYSGLILPDIALALFSFGSVYYVWMSLKSGGYRDCLFGGAFFGLALLSKFTALLLIPVLLLLVVLHAIQGKQRIKARMALIPGIAVFTLLAGYGFDLTPFVQGISYQLAHATDGHSSFLNGTYSISGWWYYYIVVFLLKTPVPLMIMLVTALILYIKKPVTNLLPELFLLVPATAIFVFFCIKHQSVGIRYILPIYPFLFVFAGRAMAVAGNFRYALYLLVVWYVAGTLWTTPNYLAYFNEFAGGPDNGYTYLVDSNLDWGQDLKGLKKYMDSNGVKRVTLSYFGADSPQRYGIEYDWLPSHHLFNPKPDSPVQIPPGQLLAISATNLQGVYFDNKAQYRWLLDYQPVAKIGYSIFIYDLNRR